MFDLISIIKTAGYAGIAFIVFAETGLFIGFFLPGDSLLFTAGFLASQGYLDIIILATLSFAAAIAGDSVGYAFGKRVGPRIFTREDSIFFHKDHIERTRQFYEKHGGKTIILARFVPIVRTFAPILAGVGQMKYSKFFSYNVIGAFVWAMLTPVLGYFLGSTVPNADKYLLPIVLLIIIVSVIPPAMQIWRHEGSRNQIKTRVRRIFKRNA